MRKKCSGLMSRLWVVVALGAVLALTLGVGMVGAHTSSASEPGVSKPEPPAKINPGGCSLWVRATPGTPEFAQAVKEASRSARIVFAEGAWPEELLAAIPEAKIKVDAPNGRGNERVVSYYATYPNRPPSVGALVTFASSTEEFAGLDEWLEKTDSQYRYNMAVGKNVDPNQNQEITPEGVVAASDSKSIVAADYMDPDLAYVGEVNWAYNLDWHCHTVITQYCWYQSNDTNTSNDYFFSKAFIGVDPGYSMYGNDWQVHYHTFKFQCYGSGKTIIDSDPQTTPESGSFSVNLSNTNASMNYTYNMYSATCNRLQSGGTAAKWQHLFAWNSSSAKYSTTARPAYVMKVGEGAPCQTFVNGTINVWRDFPIYGRTEISHINVVNSVTSFYRP